MTPSSGWRPVAAWPRGHGVEEGVPSAGNRYRPPSTPLPACAGRPASDSVERPESLPRATRIDTLVGMAVTDVNQTLSAARGTRAGRAG